MNHSLTTFAAYMNGFAAGHLPLWNEANFGGYSLVALPYQYPNPAALLAAALRIEDFYFFAGIEAAVLFFLAGLFCYLFIRALDYSRLAAAAAGVLYQTSALSVLKVSQNDLSFLALVLFPVLLLFIRRIADRFSAWNYLLLFLISASLLNFAFLQKVAYVSLVASLYVAWLSFERRSWRPLVAAGAAALPALVLAIPRLVTVGEDFVMGNRMAGAAKSSGGARLQATEILRWFDERILGATFEEMPLLGNSINLHEGFLLYLTSFAPFLIAYALAARLPWRRADSEARFSVYVTAFCVLAAFTTAGNWLLWRLFFRVDFIHYRILMVAVLPCCVLLAVMIDRAREIAEPSPRRWVAPRWLVAMAALCCVIMIELIGQYVNSRGLHLPLVRGHHLQGGATFRVFASAIILAGLWWFAVRRAQVPHLHVALAALLIGQGVAYASLTVWGPGRWPDPPTYQTPTRLMAKVGDYRAPSDDALRAVRSRLDADRYRTAFVCPPKEVGIFCPTQIANFWSLRAIDGYVSNVPQRLAILPIGPTVSIRVISFFSLSELDWPLMGLLNVRYAVMFRPELFTNAVRSAGRPVRELSPADLTIHENPARVAPRVFFVNSIVSVQDMTEAAKALFPKGRGNPEGYVPEEISYVEGLTADRLFSKAGELSAVFQPERVIVRFAPVGQERFLVLNERYDPNWVARDDVGNKLKVLPTNVMMRGVIVPAASREITFEYKPFLVRSSALVFYVAGVLFAVAMGLVAALMPRKQ